MSENELQKFLASLDNDNVAAVAKIDARMDQGLDVKHEVYSEEEYEEKYAEEALFKDANGKPVLGKLPTGRVIVRDTTRVEAAVILPEQQQERAALSSAQRVLLISEAANYFLQKTNKSEVTERVNSLLGIYKEGLASTPENFKKIEKNFNTQLLLTLKDQGVVSQEELFGAKEIINRFKYYGAMLSSDKAGAPAKSVLTVSSVKDAEGNVVGTSYSMAHPVVKKTAGQKATITAIKPGEGILTAIDNVFSEIVARDDTHLPAQLRKVVSEPAKNAWVTVRHIVPINGGKPLTTRGIRAATPTPVEGASEGKEANGEHAARNYEQLQESYKEIFGEEKVRDLHGVLLMTEALIGDPNGESTMVQGQVDALTSLQFGYSYIPQNKMPSNKPLRLTDQQEDQSIIAKVSGLLGYGDSSAPDLQSTMDQINTLLSTKEQPFDCSKLDHRTRRALLAAMTIYQLEGAVPVFGCASDQDRAGTVAMYLDLLQRADFSKQNGYSFTLESLMKDVAVSYEQRILTTRSCAGAEGMKPKSAPNVSDKEGSFFNEELKTSGYDKTSKYNKSVPIDMKKLGLPKWKVWTHKIGKALTSIVSSSFSALSGGSKQSVTKATEVVVAEPEISPMDKAINQLSGDVRNALFGDPENESALFKGVDQEANQVVVEDGVVVEEADASQSVEVVSLHKDGQMPVTNQADIPLAKKAVPMKLTGCSSTMFAGSQSQQGTDAANNQTDNAQPTPMRKG